MSSTRRHKKGCDCPHHRHWREVMTVTPADEIDQLKDRISLLLSINYDLRKERDGVQDKLSLALETLRQNGIHIESKDCWCRPTVESHA